jgi:hypothetical protein
METKITRDTIISTLFEQLELNPKVLALWLEGADATNWVDEYSDLDICCSVEAGAIAQVAGQAQQALASLGSLDLIHQLNEEKDFHHLVFHLAGTSDYLLIDFVIFVARGSQFVAGDEIEKPLVLFDRANIIRYLPGEEYLASLGTPQRLQALKETVAQYSRLEKYLKRGQFLEAWGYYHKWLLTPLIELLRMKYTPHHPDYFIVHISRHLPADVLARLEDLFKINSVTEIEAKSREALAFFEETAAGLSFNTMLSA